MKKPGIILILLIAAIILVTGDEISLVDKDLNASVNATAKTVDDYFPTLVENTITKATFTLNNLEEKALATETLD